MTQTSQQTVITNLESLLQSEGGLTPLECCQAIRYVVLTVLERDLPTGLYSHQEKVTNLIMDIALNEAGEEGIVNQCRQSGKTEAVVISLIVLAIYYCRVRQKNFRVGIFAPAATQTILTVKERLRRRCIACRTVLRAFGVALTTGEGIGSELFILQHKNENGDEYDFRVRCFSISPDANITSETLNLIIIEQCEDVDPLKMENDVFPMAAAVGGARLLDGTPKNEIINSYFYDACTKREQGPHYIRVDDIMARAVNPKYDAYCREMIDKLGEYSVAYQTQFRCNWRMGVDKLCSIDSFLPVPKGVTRTAPIFLPIVDGKPMFIVGASWDVAKSMDRSVVHIGWRDGTIVHVIKWIVYEGDDYTDQVDDVAQQLLSHGVTQILVDSSGVGDPTVDMLRKKLKELPGGIRVRVEGIRTSINTEDDITSKLLLQAFRDKLFDIPSPDEAHSIGGIKMRRYRDMFITECCDLEKHWNGNLLHTCAPKGQDRHDDFPKSFGLLLRCLLKPPVKISIRMSEY
jgi:hypothetical protein